MSLKAKIITAVVSLLFIAPFVFDALTVEELSWKDIQRYGGVKIETPMETQDGYYMPLICDVSGRDSISIKPIALSSINVFKRAKVKIKDHEIFISISIGGAIFKNETSKSPAVKLGKIDHGHYKVFYESGELIGEFYI